MGSIRGWIRGWILGWIRGSVLFVADMPLRSGFPWDGQV